MLMAIDASLRWVPIARTLSVAVALRSGIDDVDGVGLAVLPIFDPFDQVVAILKIAAALSADAFIGGSVEQVRPRQTGVKVGDIAKVSQRLPSAGRADV
jgi:hypothetical protein